MNVTIGLFHSTNMTKKKSKRDKQSNQNNSERNVDPQYSGSVQGNSCGNPDPGKSYQMLLTNSDDATDVSKISEYEIRRAWVNNPLVLFD